MNPEDSMISDGGEEFPQNTLSVGKIDWVQPSLSPQVIWNRTIALPKIERIKFFVDQSKTQKGLDRDRSAAASIQDDLKRKYEHLNSLQATIEAQNEERGATWLPDVPTQVQPSIGEGVAGLLGGITSGDFGAAAGGVVGMAQNRQQLEYQQGVQDFQRTRELQDSRIKQLEGEREGVYGEIGDLRKQESQAQELEAKRIEKREEHRFNTLKELAKIGGMEIKSRSDALGVVAQSEFYFEQLGMEMPEEARQMILKRGDDAENKVIQGEFAKTSSKVNQELQEVIRGYSDPASIKFILDTLNRDIVAPHNARYPGNQITLPSVDEIVRQNKAYREGRINDQNAIYQGTQDPKLSQEEAALDAQLRAMEERGDQDTDEYARVYDRWVAVRSQRQGSGAVPPMNPMGSGSTIQGPIGGGSTRRPPRSAKERKAEDERVKDEKEEAKRKRNQAESDVRQRVNKLKGEVASLTADKEAMIGRRGKLNRQIAQAVMDRDAAKDTDSEMADSFEKRRASLQSQLDALNRDLAAIDAKIKAKQDQLKNG